MSRAYGYTSYGGPETETWFDRPQPVPGSSELVIKVKAAGVNPADYKIRSGTLADPQAAPDFPLVLGVEAAGVVVAVGSDVEGFAQGDAVMGTTLTGSAEREGSSNTCESGPQRPLMPLSVRGAARRGPVPSGPAWDGLLDNPTAATADHEVVFSTIRVQSLLDRLDSAERGTARRERTTLLRPANQRVPFICPCASAGRSARR